MKDGINMQPKLPIYLKLSVNILITTIYRSTKKRFFEICILKDKKSIK